MPKVVCYTLDNAAFIVSKLPKNQTGKRVEWIWDHYISTQIVVFYHATLELDWTVRLHGLADRDEVSQRTFVEHLVQAHRECITRMIPCENRCPTKSARDPHVHLINLKF